MNKNIFFVSLSFFLFSVSNLHAKISPSFDCDKASNEAEKLICSDDELAKLDVEMNEWYKKVIRWQKLIANMYSGSEEDTQKKWLKRRDNFECNPKIFDKRECLISLHEEAIHVYKNRLLRLELTRVCNWGEEGCKFNYIDELLKEGADLNGYDKFYGQCWSGPVYFSALSWNKKTVFNYLVEHGVDFKTPIRDDCKGFSQVLDAGGRSGSAFHFFDEIIALNPNLDYKNDGKYLFLFAETAIAKGGGANIDSDYLQYINKMISYNRTIVNYTSTKGDNVLITIFKYINNSNFFRYDRTLNLVKYLIAQGIDVSHKNNEGHNALYYLNNSKEKFTISEYEKLERLLHK